MPIQIQMQGMSIDHIEMEVPLTTGKTEKRHSVMMHCPVTGLVVNAIFDEHEMEVTENGDLLLKKQSDVDLAIAGPDDVPDMKGGRKKKGPPRRPPQAGPGRPGR